MKRIIKLFIPAILGTLALLSFIMIAVGIFTLDLLLILGGTFFTLLILTIFLEIEDGELTNIC